MVSSMIHWRLRDVMDREGIQAKALAQEIGVTANAMTNLRGSEMPRINGERLNGLILGLNKLRRADSKLITLTDVIEFSLTPDEMSEVGISV
ncbi:XRE family transcriptional regulator [Leptolyngbyaceae cyanobacterium CCMR0082]|uniref:XRE family transcriptional regulator n=1 Tax=Adonisia turfae CCMR0082 TaxID=2304604 RepID=A0A6M0SGV6_9CYAN|nr:helix-turn-helix transcriptional regulator [Adonisia turfae]NEZ67799.1 XRE family transcriptional regulator [Adonisia turfae CCMR0082]